MDATETSGRSQRHQRRRSESRHQRQEEQQPNLNSNNSTEPVIGATNVDLSKQSSNSNLTMSLESEESYKPDIGNIDDHDKESNAPISNENLSQDSMSTGSLIQEPSSLPNTSLECDPLSNQKNPKTVLLVNGLMLQSENSLNPTMQDEEGTFNDSNAIGNEDTIQRVTSAQQQLESPTHPNASGSSRNSSGDALSLRETLQHLPSTKTSNKHRHRNRSPQIPSSINERNYDMRLNRNTGGDIVDREPRRNTLTPSSNSLNTGTVNGTENVGGRKQQSLSDPQASPAQRSVRSRTSLEKSPRRKRSKSESRRRRERKLIAAGEMEVRQANETLMRYLKQCSEMNDASLSGELEIDQNFDERRVHRKTKSQRDKRGHLISKLYTAGGLTSILKELSDDILPVDGEDIYNPFTPVVSPTDDTPSNINKIFLQTSSGYRPVENCYYNQPSQHDAGMGDSRMGGGPHASNTTIPIGVGGRRMRSMLFDNGCNRVGAGCIHTSESYGDTNHLLEAVGRKHEITTKIYMACFVQRVWLLISNISHGLLAGLALAHLLFILCCHPMDWTSVISQISLAGETESKGNGDTASYLADDLLDATGDDKKNSLLHPDQPSSLIQNYASFADTYLNTFYCLAVICLVSVLDRMDICRWDLTHATELISFRWLIIAMIYIGTIILTISSNLIDEQLYYNNNVNVTLTQYEMLSSSILNVWSSLSVTRSIGAICGWIMIGLTPHEDLLYEHLVDLTKYL